LDSSRSYQSECTTRGKTSPNTLLPYKDRFVIPKWLILCTIALLHTFGYQQAAGQLADVSKIETKMAGYDIPGLEILSATKGEQLVDALAATDWQAVRFGDSIQKAISKHWFRCRLTNGSQKPLRIGFYNNGSLYSNLYVCSPTDTILLQSGEFTPANNLQFLHDGNYNSFEVTPGDTISLLGYMHYSGRRIYTLSYAFYNIGYYHRVLAGTLVNEWGGSQYQGFVMGALIFALLFIGLIGIWFKNDSYWYYMLFLLGGIVFILIRGLQYSYLGMLSQYLGTYRATLSESIQFLFFAAYAMFVIKLLQLKRNKRLYKLARVMVFLYCFYAVGAGIYLLAAGKLGVSTPWYVGARVVAFAMSITLLAGIIRSVRSPVKNFYIAGTLSFLIISFLSFIRQSNPDTFLSIFSPVWYLQTGILLEAILFGLALGYQMYLVEKDKRSNYKAYIQQLEVNEKLVREMNVELERTVAERTAELAVEKEKQLRTEYEQQITQLEMQALRSQMNPHFIFNSLASIRYQIQSGQYNSAMQYLLTFSKLLRLTLENSRKDTVTLEEELQLTKLYLDIEGYRLGDAFIYQLDISENVDIEAIELPPLLLQPYAENAIKHGLMESTLPQKKIMIKVAEEDEGYTIIIEDNGIGRAAAQTRRQESNMNQTSLGMQITSERMKVFTRKYGHQLEANIEDIQQPQGATGTRVIIHYKPKYHV